jgi:3-oxoacyl-[acyl-carrier protein] reductase
MGVNSRIEGSGKTMVDTARIVVVTGGSKGIGRQIALKFAEDRARLVLVHYDPDDSAGNETLDMVAAKGAEAECHRVDISTYEDAEALFRDTLSKFGKVDVLVNNAGITRDNLLMRMSEEDWDQVIQVNLKSVFNCSRAVLRAMVKQRGGHIVNISSVAGQIGNAGQANYATSKAGIIGFTKTIAREVASRGINVNAVAPGFIDTEMTATLSATVRESLVEQIPLGRIGQPEDVAEAVYWLCSPGAAYITGQVIHVNGGMFM